MKFSIKIEKDTFSPYIKQLQSKSKGGQMRAFMQRQHALLRGNISEALHRQVYFNGTNEESWQDLKAGTMFKRIKRNNWYSQDKSKLKETFELMSALIRNSRAVAKKESNGYSISLQPPSGTHMGYDNKPISMLSLIGIHQYGDMSQNIPPRPPISMLQDTQDRLVSNFVTYFFS